MPKSTLFLLMLSLGTALFSGSAFAESRWEGIEVHLHPRCQGGAPERVQPVEQWLDLKFASPIFNSGQYTRTLPLGGRILAVADGTVYLSSVPVPASTLSWTAIGRLPSSSIHCNWKSDTLRIELLPGMIAALHESPHGECKDQEGDIPIIGSFLSKPAVYRLEIGPESGVPSVALQNDDIAFFETLWECVRARSEKTSTLR